MDPQAHDPNMLDEVIAKRKARRQELNAGGVRDLLKPLRDEFGLGHLSRDLHERTFQAAAQPYLELLERGVGEREIHAWLKEHPYVILHGIEGAGSIIERVAVFKELPLGDEHRVDFGVVTADSDGARWTFIELESPNAPLFTKAGDPSKELTHGLRQLDDWSSFIKSNEAFIKRRLAEWHESAEIRGPTQSWRAPNFMVVIGRESSLTPATRRRKAEMNERDPRRQIATFDRFNLLRWRNDEPRPLGVFDVAKERGHVDGEPWPDDQHPWRLGPEYLDALHEAKSTGKPVSMKRRASAERRDP